MLSRVAQVQTHGECEECIQVWQPRRILPGEVPPNGVNRAETATEAKCNLEVSADPAALVS